MTPRPTLTAVARAAGVSTSTASRALRDDPRVADTTRSRVRHTAQRMGFRSNQVARALRLGGLTRLLGLVVPNLQDPFFTSVTTGVHAAARAAGHQVIIGYHNEDPQAQQRLVEQMVAHRVSAVLIVPAPGTDPQPLAREADLGTWLVLIDRPVPGLRCTTVTTDNVGGASRLTEALLERGHRRLGVLTIEPSIWTQVERLAGVRTTLAQQGLSLPEDRIVHGGAEVLRQRVRDLLTGPDAPTALLALSVPPLLSALLTGELAGAKVELASFDSHPLYGLLPVPVLCLEQDTDAIGRVVVDRALHPRPAGAEASVVLPLSPLQRRGGDHD